jgi:hypothetical protein
MRIIPYIVFISLLLAILACSSVGTIKNTNVAHSGSYNQGDTMHIGNMYIIVLGWEKYQPGEYSKPEEGNQFIGVTMLIVNGGKSPMDLTELLWTIQDSTGQKYKQAGEAQDLCTTKSNIEELVPGERLLGCTGFEIPTDATGLVLVYDNVILHDGPQFITLKNIPGLLAVPAAGSVKGERLVPVVAIKKPGKIGAFRITINSLSNPTGAGYEKPEGYVFLMVDITIENISSSSTDFSAAYTYLKDPFGRIYYTPTFGADQFGGIDPSGELSAGEKVRGQIVFEVPKDMKDLLFVYDDSRNDKGKLFIKIS